MAKPITLKTLTDLANQYTKELDEKGRKNVDQVPHLQYRAICEAILVSAAVLVQKLEGIGLNAEVKPDQD